VDKFSEKRRAFERWLRSGGVFQAHLMQWLATPANIKPDPTLAGEWQTFHVTRASNLAVLGMLRLVEPWKTKAAVQ
jgi:hypothetical protein